MTALEGEPLPSGDIASRLGGFDDVAAIEASNAGGSTTTTDAQLIDLLLGSKNTLHNNYQDFQAFLDNGGKIGLQHDTLLYGAYLLNPFLVRVDLVPMLVVNQGEVAVIKGFVGLPTADTSGAEFKFGSIVRPGHRGIWQEPLRTGKYAINPRVYAAEIVPTFILTLNWADATSEAHDLDAQLSSIVGKSREGFIFQIDLQVQIHVPDTKAPKVISMVGTMRNLVSEVLQSAVGNHFRNTLQALEAIKFIETRREVQAAAFEAITRYLSQYEVETKGVYIQDVAFPQELVVVLTQREIANQEKATFEEQQRAETSRIEMEKAKGTANMQSQLASAQVGVQIKTNEAQAREQEAKGEAAYVQLTGEAEGARRQAIGLGEAKATEALGLARAIGFNAQKEALGGPATAVVAVANAVADGHITVVPEVLVTGGGWFVRRPGRDADALPGHQRRREREGRGGPGRRRTPRCPRRSRRPNSPTTRAVPTDRSHRLRDVGEQFAAVVGRERDVTGVERDAIEVLIPQHVAVVQTVGKHSAEREPELAHTVAERLRAGIGEREVDVHAVDAVRERVVAGTLEQVEQVVADRTHGHHAVVVVGAVLEVQLAATRPEHVGRRVAHGAAQSGAGRGCVRPCRGRRPADTPAARGRRWSSGRRARPTGGGRGRRSRRTRPTRGCSRAAARSPPRRARRWPAGCRDARRSPRCRARRGRRAQPARRRAASGA